MTSIWRLNEDRVEFERVTSAVLDADPEGTYVIQQPDNTFRLRIGNAPHSRSRRAVHRGGHRVRHRRDRVSAFRRLRIVTAISQSRALNNAIQSHALRE